MRYVLKLLLPSFSNAVAESPPVYSLSRAVVYMLDNQTEYLLSLHSFESKGPEWEIK